MSVNINVSGKFTARNTILDDKERVKKEMEEERRKTRLQQVREESKNMARKIRNDVSAEKNRQLRNLEAIKAQELNCWRENVLARGNHDYSAAIFQVGQAHHAAQVENCQRRVVGGCQRRCCWPVSRPCRNNVENHQPRTNTCQPPSKKSIKCAQTQTTKCETRTPPERRRSTLTSDKPRRTVCFHDDRTNCGFCYSTEEPDSPLCDSPCEYSHLDSSTCSSELVSPRKCMRTQAPSLCKTPAVCLDIDVDSSDSTCVRQAEICDKFAENNRQFCRTIRKSPEPTRPIRGQNETTPPPPPQKKSPPKKSAPSAKSQLSDKPSTSKAAAPASAAAEKPKRFTQVSDLIEKKESTAPPKSPTKKTPAPASLKSPQRKATPPTTPTRKTKSPAKKLTSPAKAAAAPPPRPPLVRKLPLAAEKPKSPSKSQSPQRRGSAATIKSSQAPSASEAPTTSAPTATLVSTLVDAATSYTGMPAAPSVSATGSDRVQFYDYNNKFAKEYAQPSTITVRIRPSERCLPPPNAMEQASIEQQLRASRERDMELLRQKCDERGQKAIEREQVRRDCNELTQKLELLMRQHPELIPTDAKVMARHRFTDNAARKETKMNAAIEEILLRPAIITCPEVGTQRTTPHAHGDTAATAKPIPSDLNLGAPHRNAADANNSASTDSCCSILLGYVDDQSKQIRNELNAYETRPQQQQNPEKSRKLKNLLERIEQLREGLLQELQGDKISLAAGGGEGGSIENVQQIVESISDLRRERENILLDDLNRPMEQKRRAAPAAPQMSTTAREKELQQKEDILEQKVREFYQKVTTSTSSISAGGVSVTKQQSRTSSSGSGGVEFTAIAKKSHEFDVGRDRPLEIIIKVKGDPNCIEITEKPKSSKLGKSPRRVSTLIQQSSSPAKYAKKAAAAAAAKKRTSGLNKSSGESQPPAATSGEVLGRQNSYDSNSTSYRSLPPTLGNQVDALVDRRGVSSPERATSPTQQQRTRLNPLIAHYIQRLLGMTRNSVLALSVSSSQVETPTSSIINTTPNVTSSSDHQEHLLQERLVRVERFVEENRSFITELEESLRLQDSHISLETSMRVFEDIWRQRLQNNERPVEIEHQGSKSTKKTPAKKRTSTTKRKSAAQKVAKKDKSPAATPRKQKADFQSPTKRAGEINRRLHPADSDPKSYKKTSENNRRIPDEYLESRLEPELPKRSAQIASTTKAGKRIQETSRSRQDDIQYEHSPTQDKYAERAESSGLTKSGAKTKEPSRIPQRTPADSAHSSGISRLDSKTREVSRSRTDESQHYTGPPQQRSADSTQNLGVARSGSKTRGTSHSRLVEGTSDSGSAQQSATERLQDIGNAKIGSNTREISRSELVESQSRSAEKVKITGVAKSISKHKETSGEVANSRSEFITTRERIPSDSTHSIGVAKSRSSLSELLESQIYAEHVQPGGGPDGAQKSTKSTSQPSKAREVKISDHDSVLNDVPSTSKVAAQKKRALDPGPPQSTPRADKAIETRSPQSPEAEKQIARYAQLTDNCTNRIAELNELISKVREEKQRLLEVTLSSVSDNGTTRNSTEYLELPDGRRRSVSSSGKSADQSQSRLLDSNMETLVADEPPLEKHKQTGLSRDSGISMSRPQTAQEQLPYDCEPVSYGSTTTQSYSTSSQQQRKTRPPPTLRRFSPQLIEDELAHELSTIMEVDTPVTSRLNTSLRPTTATAAASTNVSGASGNIIPAPPGCTPVAFPTFEEYLQQLNLNITHIQPEQSMRIEQEFNELVAALKEARDNSAFNYVEFPSLTTYLQDVAANECDDPAELSSLGHDNTPETIENLLACLRIANLTIKSFPSPNTYQQRLRTNTPEGDNDDTTESPENACGGLYPGAQGYNTTTADTESESMNIEEELKRRNILKNSFPRTATTTEEHLFASAHREGEKGGERATIYAHLIAATESGIEKLSTSDNLSGDLEQDLRGLGMQWPAAMRRKGKVAAALSSTTSTSATLQSSPHQDGNQRSYREASAAGSIHFSADTSLNQMGGRPLNLRDFLTRELLKHTNTSCSSSNTTDDSLRQQFFHSIIGTITPTCTPRANAVTGSNGKTLDRQKTSTPVISHSSRSEDNSSSASTTTGHLFSGESRLSSVHFADRTEVRYFPQPQRIPQQQQQQQTQKRQKQQDPYDAECRPDPWERR